MKHPRTAREIGDIHVDQAARARPARAPAVERDVVLSLPRPAARDVPLPEPVTWRGLNGREPAGWEEPLIVAARERERRLELSLLAGTLGQP